MFPERRQNLLTLMGNANIISRCGVSSSRPVKLGDIRDHFLEESVVIKDTKLESNMQFVTWIRRIKKAEYFPTVLFPPQEAGPDIVFMLQHQTEPSRKILCALQASHSLGVAFID